DEWQDLQEKVEDQWREKNKKYRISKIDEADPDEIAAIVAGVEAVCEYHNVGHVVDHPAVPRRRRMGSPPLHKWRDVTVRSLFCLRIRVDDRDDRLDQDADVDMFVNVNRTADIRDAVVEIERRAKDPTALLRDLWAVEVWKLLEENDVRPGEAQWDKVEAFLKDQHPDLPAGVLVRDASGTLSVEQGDDTSKSPVRLLRWTDPDPVPFHSGDNPVEVARLIKELKFLADDHYWKVTQPAVVAITLDVHQRGMPIGDSDALIALYACIRRVLSLGHSTAELDQALAAFNPDLPIPWRRVFTGKPPRPENKA
ncbi:hypothetical protein GGE65_007706, partial [Skermanella aerolata]|uniref:hypothetical protein n=1 Tax=Skermanella aerolata TaxID=393310 RepID=UPI003D23292C